MYKKVRMERTAKRKTDSLVETLQNDDERCVGAESALRRLVGRRNLRAVVGEKTVDEWCANGGHMRSPRNGSKGRRFRDFGNTF